MTFRLFVSHVVVAVLTGIALTAVLFVLIARLTAEPTLQIYQATALQYSLSWLAGTPDGQPSDLDLDPMPGWTLVVGADDTIRWSRGDITCRAGTALSACAAWAERPPTQGFFDHPSGERWAYVDVPLVTGDRVVMVRGPITAQPFLVYGEFIIQGYTELFIFEMVSRGVMALPIALVLAWLFTRRLTRRLKALSEASRRFARGELTARIADPRTDDLGLLAQQFDDMASALTQNISALHELAQRNAELAAQAEQSAITAERARISRELHDAVAQRLFSLSVSTTALPELITQDAARGAQHARTIAEMAEQTLLDLRAVLVQMRPNPLQRQGLAESLRELFRQWQVLNGPHITADLMLTGRHLPAVIEDAVYQITQEALSNVARHAGAHAVAVSLVEGQHQLVLSISDDGRGFEAEHLPVSGKYGLMSMRERASVFGGTLILDSQMGKGTTVQVCLPVQWERPA
jgi:NarL family two-component system sensor histidine kinase LiaS